MGLTGPRIKGVGLCFATLVIVAAVAGCTPRTADSSGEDGAKNNDSVAVDLVWSPDSDCAVCHTSEQSSYNNPVCEASMHPVMSCTQCHTEVPALQSAHKGKATRDKIPNRLKKTQIADDLCLNCHYENRDALIAATDESVTLIDAEGTSCNPHNPEGIAEHETLLCADCHNMHGTDKTQDRALDKCVSCHHAGVFACYTCHD